LIAGTVQNNPGASVTWNGLSITAPDEGTKAFSIRVFFTSAVTDNHNIDIQITAVAEAGGSKFEFADGNDGTGGAQTTPGFNLIDVIATQLDFEAVLLDSEQGINIPITPNQPKVFAHDLEGNLDLDFAATATVTSGVGMATIPAAFSNVSPGILDFPGFTYTNTGNGTLTVTAGGLSKTSNTVDVIHTTFTNLDLGGGVAELNNGIEALPLIIAGGFNKALIGFSLSALQNTTNEPVLNEITVRFGNPIAESLTNIRLVSSATTKYDFLSSTLINNSPVVGADTATFQNINVSLNATEIYYFVIADIKETADFETPTISPAIIANGTPVAGVANGDILLSAGSIEANIIGRTYGFDDVNPPVIFDDPGTAFANDGLTPLNGNENFPQNELIKIRFNESVIPLDSVITVYKLIDGSILSTLKLDPLLTSADSTEFSFDPSTPISGTALEGDTDYYILIAAGDTLNGIGFVDKSGNVFAGISSSNDWVFKTSDNVAPFFTADLTPSTLPADAVNIIDVGFDLRVALDEPGKIYYLVVDPNTDPGIPTVAEIRSGVYGTTLAAGTADILKGFVYHYISIFDDSNFPTGGSKDFRVWVTAEDIALPTPNQMIDGDPLHPGKTSIDGQFTNNPGSGIIIQSIPGSVPADICLGDPQIVFAPINILEGSNSDFTTGNGQDINFVLPPGFEFNTASTLTITTQGGDISSPGFSFVNATILKITYDISGTANRDKLTISNMEVKALDVAGTSGDVIRLGGTGANSIADGAPLVSLNTIQLAPVTFTTVPNTTSIGNVNEKVPLIADLTPLDKGNSLFSGPGVFGDTLFVAAAGLGTHTITLNYTNEDGCTSEFSLDRTIFDSNQAIAGLKQSYCTDDGIATIPFDGRLPNFILVGLGIEVAPDQLPEIANPADPFLIDVNLALDTLLTSDYTFDPGLFKFQANYDKFTNIVAETNEGGLLGELLFTGVYQNQQNTNQLDTLEQRVKIYFSPTSEITINGYGPIGDNTFDPNNILPTSTAPAELEFCEDTGNILLEGSAADGHFAITLPTLFATDSINFPGLTDNGDGTAILNTQFMVDSSDFNFGEIQVKFIVDKMVSACSNTVTQTIRINPKPRANFIVPPIICEDTEISFSDATAFLPSDSTVVNASVANAVFHPFTSWQWDFNDAANSTGENPNLATGADTLHTYIDPGLYDVTLQMADDFGCSSDTTITLVIGGLPTADPGTPGFVFAGTSLNKTITFIAQAQVVSSSASLNHNIDSVYFDVDGDGVIDISESDNDPTQPNNIKYAYNGYSNAGIYDAKLIAVSTIGCRTEFNRNIVIMGNIIADSTETNSYAEGFSNDNGGWIAIPEIDNNGEFKMPLDSVSWEWGIPSSDTAKVWVTGIDKAYKDGERSYVYSPVFDIAGLSRPMIQMDIQKQLAGQDGVIFEYSTDSLNIMDPTKTWTALGTEGEGIDWFNAVGLAGSPGIDPTGLGWADSLSGWLTAKHDLGEVYGNDPTKKQRVMFRFGLGAIPGVKTDQNGNPYNGFAFDNLFMGNRTRTVLLENFTSMAGGVENKNENDAINTLVTDPTGAELVVINYHTAFDGEDALNEFNPAEPSARALYYGISENPRVAIDGFTSPDGTNSSNLTFTQWGQKFYSKRTLQISPFSINLTTPNTGDGKLHMKADITAVSNKITNDFIVQTLVVEKSLTDGDLGVTANSGETVFYNTMRKMLPNAAGTKFTGGLADGNSISVEQIWEPLDITDIANQTIAGSKYEVVVFIQDEVTKEVHQAARANINFDLVLGIQNELQSDGIALYPNPADKNVTLIFANKITKGVSGFIFDNTGKKVKEVYIGAGQNIVELNTTDYLPGIYMITIPLEAGAITKRFMITHR